MPDVDPEGGVDVFLVHGTLFRMRFWERPKSSAEVRRLFPWTDPDIDGSLAAKIAALETEGIEVRISAVPWRGQNSSTAREAGATDLARRLVGQPERPKVIIAHSHGGNVAMRALQQMKRGHDNVLGVVCLATPFLQLLPRDVKGMLWLRQIGLVFLLLFELFVGLMALSAATVGVIGVFQEVFGGPLQELSLSLILGLLAGGVLVLWLIPRAHRRLRLRNDLEAERYTVSTQREALGDHETPVEAPFLCICAAGDEAGAWLEFCSMIAALPYVLRNRLLSSIGVAALTIVAFVLLGWPYVAADPEEGAVRFALALAYSLAIACGAYFIVTIVAITLAELTARLPVTFGSPRVEGRLTRTTVSLAPLYARHSEFETYGGNALLVHSIYTSQEVQERVVGWVRGRIAAARAAG